MCIVHSDMLLCGKCGGVYFYSTPMSAAIFRG